MLEFRGVNTYYGELHVLKDVNYEIEQGRDRLPAGRQCQRQIHHHEGGAGHRAGPRPGDIFYEGQQINTLPTAARVKLGIAPVPEARRLFPRMTVLENLEMGAYTRRDRENLDEDLERVYGLFPRVKERRQQLAGTLSGGEQQMVAIGRALMARPRLICMDEPSMGLSPAFVDQVFEIIQTINKQGTTIFVVEQNAAMALSIADRGYVLQTGEVVLSGTAKSLLDNQMVQQAYLGQMEA